MKKCSQVVIALVALIIAFGCVNGLLAHQRLGGYKEIPNDDPEVVAAADFAIGEQGQKQEISITLVSIEKAASQVVAGINYRLCLKVEVDDEAQEIQAVVHRNLQKEYSLTSWKEENCSGGQADQKLND